MSIDIFVDKDKFHELFKSLYFKDDIIIFNATFMKDTRDNFVFR